MKKKILIISGLILCLSIVGCGKKEEDKSVIYQDEGVTLVGENIPETMEVEESDYIPSWQQYNASDEFDRLDKDAYDEMVKNLPKDENGVFDYTNFSPEQKAMFDKFQDGKFITDFSADVVLTDVLDFFSEKNLNRIQNVKYTETLNKIRGSYKENKDDYKNFVYNAIVVDNAEYKHIEADCDYRIGKKHVSFQYNYLLDYPEGYYYGYKIEPNGTYFHVGQVSNFVSPLLDISDIMNKGISNFGIVSIDGNIYECSFDVDATLFNQTSLADKSFIEEVFKKDESSQITGEVWVNYNTNKIDTITFVQTFSDTETNLVSFGLEEYNNDKLNKNFEDALSYEDAVVMDKYIQAKRDEYLSRPDRVTVEEPTEEPTEEVDEEEERTKLEEQMEHLWDTLDIPPEGTTALLDGNGKRIKDIEGHTIFVYKDTFIPYDPTQIPEGMDTPIGAEPVIGALLKPATTDNSQPDGIVPEQEQPAE